MSKAKSTPPKWPMAPREANLKNVSCLKRILGEESGQVLPWVVVVMVVVLGMAAIVVDLGRAMVIQRQLQASADAAALAAAETLPNATYSTVGQSFSGGTGDKNVDTGGLSVGTPTITPLCLATVTAWGIPCTSTSPNAISVTETVTMPTLFAGLLGKPSIPLSATSTASKGSRPLPYNIAVIVDSTLSMTAVDNNCGGATQMACALNGVQQMLQNLNTKYDNVALFTFPNVATGSSAGVVASGSYGCTTTMPSKNGSITYEHDSSFGYYSMLYAISRSNTSYQTPWSGVAWALPYSFPPIPTSTSGYTVASGTLAPTYEVVPFANDYNTTSGTTTSLNASSNLVKAVGGESGCGGILPSNYDGNYGTYYAGALYAAQAALLAEQAANPGTKNVMVILGDGNSDGPNDSSSPFSSSPSIPSSATEAETTYKTTSALTTTAFTMPSGYKVATSNGSYPSWEGECGQAVTAAQYASTYPSSTSTNGTLVYTIAYGALASGGCTSDSNPHMTPCQALQNMATVSSTGQYFYSDWTATGGDSGCQASDSNSGITAINSIYKAIAEDLSGARLIPNGTT
ncbi:MAG: pilus assembly protein TadG-related protein [Acidobacteriaceae bacterium]